MVQVSFFVGISSIYHCTAFEEAGSWGKASAQRPTLVGNALNRPKSVTL
jgi:hypothetical protein